MNGACAKVNVVFTAWRYSAVFAVVWCPSTWWINGRIRPFVHHVRASYPDGWRYRQISFSAGRPMILVFDTKRRYSIPRGTPSVGAQNIQGWEKFASYAWCGRELLTISTRFYRLDFLIFLLKESPMYGVNKFPLSIIDFRTMSSFKKSFDGIDLTDLL